ncbi:MAG: MazG nucleotide pyrophosphohydrolase domain-containing protein, partial [Hydrogenobacter sp.]
MDEIKTLLEVVERIRKECPWDRSQTHESLKKYLIEETYELLDAIDKKDDKALLEELGDVFLQVL